MKLHHKQLTNRKTERHKQEVFKKDIGNGRVGVRNKGEVKGGRTEKTEKEKETEKDCLFQPAPCRCLFRHQPAGFQKGPMKGGAPCPLPTRVIKARKQPVVRHLWDGNTLVGLLPTRTPVYRDLPPIKKEICRFSPFPARLVLAAGK